jgi:hypothetical protein
MTIGFVTFPGASWKGPGKYPQNDLIDEVIAWCAEHEIAFHFHGLGYVQRAGWKFRDLPVGTDEEKKKVREIYDTYVRDTFEHYHPEPIAVCDFESRSEGDGSAWNGAWSLPGAALAAEPGFKGDGCLKLAGAGDAAERGVDLSGAYNSHLFYRWTCDGYADGADVAVEIADADGPWERVKVHDAGELDHRRIEGDWHAGYATISALDGRPNARIRFRAIGDILPFRIDELQVIADDAQEEPR